MKRFALIALLVFVLFPIHMAWALNEWTVVVFVSNDDHDTAIAEVNEGNFRQMMQVGSGKGYEVLIQVDGGPKKPASNGAEILAGSSGTERFLVQKGALVSEGKLGEKNMGSPYTLWDCLKWAAEKHPAKRYCLVINSHGSGIFSWRGTGSTGSSKPGAVSFDPGRFVAYDDTNDDCLTIFEVSAVLKAFRERLNGGRPLDVVAMDACMPASLEALYQCRDVFGYLVGSPESVDMDDFRYRLVLQDLAANPRISGEQFAQRIAERTRTRLVGAWKTKGIGEAVGALDRVAVELLAAMDASGKKFNLPGLVTYGGDDRYWDLEKIARVLKDGRGEFGDAPNARVLKDLGSELLDAVLQVRLTPFGKISVAWPKPKEYQEFRDFYRALDLARSTHWDEMLDRRQLGLGK